MKPVSDLARYFVLLCILLLSACVAPVAPVAVAPVAATPAAASATGDRTGWPEKFSIGFFAGDDAQKTLQDNEPFRVYMEQKLGIPVELFTGTSYSAVIEAMRANHVDAMLVGPFAYVLAVQEANAEALAVNVGLESDSPKYTPDAPTAYYSVIITKKGSGIEKLEDLKGVDFAFVDPASTSGHLSPRTMLVKAGLDPDKDMKTVFAGSHPTAVLAVWTDKAKAGATFEENLYTLKKEGQIDFCGFPDGKIGVKRTPEEIKALYDSCPDGSITMLAYSDPIPSTPFAIRSSMPDSFKAAVKQALLDTQDDAHLITKTAQWYVDPNKEMGLQTLDQYYNSLRDIAKILNLDLKELAK